jgi:hypothetical protein
VGAGAVGGGANSFSFLFHTLIQLSFMGGDHKVFNRRTRVKAENAFGGADFSFSRP